ncbi:MAG: beta-galactosidase trimerization domain-containing protein [Bryobacter sp.]|nr:beta-galactosidase trimerization domain-containing protein [Bryobacter sp.]
MALEEGVIPFWYGEAGWEPITPELLDRLGIPRTLSKQQIREHPKMLAHQKEVLRKQIYLLPKRSFLGEDESFRHTPDPILREYDVPRFRAWLRKNYESIDAINKAWNLFEPGHVPDPFKTWDDVDRYVAAMAKEENSLRGYGREFGRVRDVLRYKADGRTATVLEIMKEFRRVNPLAPTRTGGEMGLFLPFAWRAIKMEDLAETQREYGSFYPSVHLVWHFGEVNYEVARPLYMQASFANDLFKGGWSGAWESTGGPQQVSGSKGWNYEEGSTTPGFTVNAGTMTQLYLSFLAGGFKGVGTWTWNHRKAGIEAGEYALLDRNNQVSDRAIRAGKIAQAARTYRDELWQAHKEPQVGVLLNWDNDAIWAALSVRNRDHFRHYPMQARVGVSRVLINGNIPWEYVTVDDLRSGLAPRYKVIYLAGQLALTDELLGFLTKFVEQGGRIVLDAPGGAYDEHGKVLPTAKGTAFEKLFGVELADLQYSNNVPRTLETDRLNGFVLELKPTRASVLARFQTGEPAATEHRLGKGSAVVLAWDASYACFKPGQNRMEARLRRFAMGMLVPPYSCEGAIVYRLAAPEADHYFFINDDAAKKVLLSFRNYRYRSVTDPVTGEKVTLGAPLALEGYSGRWLRFEK